MSLHKKGKRANKAKLHRQLIDTAVKLFADSGFSYDARFINDVIVRLTALSPEPERNFYYTLTVFTRLRGSDLRGSDLTSETTYLDTSSMKMYTNPPYTKDPTRNHSIIWVFEAVRQSDVFWVRPFIMYPSLNPSATNPYMQFHYNFIKDWWTVTFKGTQKHEIERKRGHGVYALYTKLTNTGGQDVDVYLVPSTVIDHEHPEVIVGVECQRIPDLNVYLWQMDGLRVDCDCSIEEDVYKQRMLTSKL